MRIIILGSNQVSQTLAENLANEENDVTLIDSDAEKLKELQNRYDLTTVVGYGSYPDILEKAHALDTEMLLAVSDNDEMNMLACQVAYSLFHIPMKIARVRAKNYLVNPEFFKNESLPVDVIISPEQLMTDQIGLLIKYPGVLRVYDFHDGIKLTAVKAFYGGLVVGKYISDIKSELMRRNISIAGIYRSKKFISIVDSTMIEVNDKVYFLCHESQITSSIAMFKKVENNNHRIIIAGGGNIGSRLAEKLEKKYAVKIIEKNQKVSEKLSIELDKTVVLYGDASDKELLVDENIDNTDVFCALTNDNDANIMSCLQAKQLGARQVVALVTNTSYLDIIEDSKIDIVISPQDTTTSDILTHVRRGDVLKVHTIMRGQSEVMELVVHGDEATSNLVGKDSSFLSFKGNVNVCGVVRDTKLIIPDDKFTFLAKDKIILFINDKKYIKQIENKFQVKIGFL